MANNDGSNRFEILLTDRILGRVLSDVGIFVSDYRTNRHLSSKLWREQGLASSDSEQSLGWLRHVHPADVDRVRQALEPVYTGRSDSYEVVFRFGNRDGSYRWVVSRGQGVTAYEHGKPGIVVGVDIDISTFKSVEHQLQHQNEQLETLHDIAKVIGASLDLEETVNRVLAQTQRILPYNTATVQLLEDNQLRVIGSYGFSNPEPVMELRFPYPERGSLSTHAIDTRQPCLTGNVKRDFPAYIHPEEEQRVRSWLGIPLVRHDQVIGLMAVDSHTKDTYTAEHLKLAATVGGHIAVALENARLHDRTYQMAMSDSLTGAGSRRRFQVEGRLLYETAQRDGSSICALMLDIDYFKDVNDRFGHSVGDVILQRIAQASMAELRGSDLFARYGGEEFVILVPGSDKQDGKVLATRICETVRRLDHREIDRSVTVSIGVACEVPLRGNGLDTLVHRADDAMYQAKQQGRNRVVVATGSFCSAISDVT